MPFGPVGAKERSSGLDVNRRVLPGRRVGAADASSIDPPRSLYRALQEPDVNNKRYLVNGNRAEHERREKNLGTRASGRHFPRNHIPL